MLRIEFPQGQGKGNSRDNKRKVAVGNYANEFLHLSKFIFNSGEGAKKHLAYVEVDLTVSKLETKRHEPQ